MLFNKKIFYSLLFIVTMVAMALLIVPSGTSRAATMQSALLTTEGKPTQPLLDLLSLLGVKHDGTLKGIVDATQKVWLRPKDKERWQVEDVLKDKAALVLPLIEQLGCLHAVAPTQKKYTYALILGAIASTMRFRLAYLLQLWERGIRFDSIVFLLGERVADSVRESKEVLLHSSSLPIKSTWHFNGILPTNEYEIMRFIYDQAELPTDFAQIPVVWINAAFLNQGNDSPKRLRQNTADTINAWLTTSPAPGACLFVSNQPYVRYQDSVIRILVPKEFTLETVGAANNGNDKITTYIDTIARWLYQEQQRRNKI